MPSRALKRQFDRRRYRVWRRQHAIHYQTDPYGVGEDEPVEPIDRPVMRAHPDWIDLTEPHRLMAGYEREYGRWCAMWREARRGV